MNTNQETQMCRDYLERKLMLNPDWLSQNIEIQIKAEKEFEKSKRDKVTLGEWTQKWLSQDKQKQLKAAVRAKRCRQNRKKGAGTKSVTLSHEAWLILSDGAKRDRVTLSEWIINHLEEEWLKAEQGT